MKWSITYLEKLKSHCRKEDINPICNLATHLYKHAKEEVSAELLDSLGHGLPVITAFGLFLDVF